MHVTRLQRQGRNRRQRLLAGDRGCVVYCGRLKARSKHFGQTPCKHVLERPLRDWEARAPLSRRAVSANRAEVLPFVVLANIEVVAAGEGVIKIRHGTHGKTAGRCSKQVHRPVGPVHTRSIRRDTTPRAGLARPLVSVICLHPAQVGRAVRAGPAICQPWACKSCAFGTGRSAQVVKDKPRRTAHMKKDIEPDPPIHRAASLAASSASNPSIPTDEALR